MIKKAAMLLAVAVTVSVVANEPQSAKKAQIMEGVKYIKMLGKEFKMNLKVKKKEDPTAYKAAVFCAKNVKKLTEKVHTKFPKGVVVRRASEKFRNSDNKPDATDLKIIKAYASEMKDPAYKPKPKWVDSGEKVRIYVPLKVEKGCVVCHGTAAKINPDIKKTLLEKYPDDKAIDFKEGDFRGIAVAELPKKK
jgi:hypothetical protein